MAITQICDPSLCTGCSACMASCGTKAIEMLPDSCGHLHPRIISDRCVECRRCIKVCPVNNPVEKREPQALFALYSNETENRFSSASGGAAAIAAQEILNKGGVVYGCIQKNCSEIFHARIDSNATLEQMKGSKYVHSAMLDCYRQCRKDLNENLEVLFTGTPCQIAGLLNFLGKDYPNLVTMDLVCHGVPSMKMLQDNITLVKEKNGIVKSNDSLKVSFRKKNRIPSKLEYGFYLGEVETVFPDDFYIVGFISGLFFRQNCFRCPYAQRKRVGDLSIGDFWGIGHCQAPDMDVNKGVSEVFVNTEKGRNFLERLKQSAVWEQRNVDEGVAGNGQLNHPFPMPKNWQAFQSAYVEEGYVAACNQYVTKERRAIRLKELKNNVRQFPVIGKMIGAAYRFVKHLK